MHVHLHVYVLLAGVPGGVDSLHVKVMKIERDSQAYKQKVNCQMYLKTLSLFCGRTKKFTEPVIIGVSNHRKPRRDEWELEGDIWRSNQPIHNSKVVDLNGLISMVDDILTTALTEKTMVRAELVQYVNANK